MQPTPSSNRLKLFKEVIQVQITLVKGLTWKTQLNKVKALRTFWTCRSSFRKLWGLKP